MSRAFQTYVEQLECASNERQLRSAMASIAGRYDLRSFAYFAMSRRPDQPIRLITNYPPAWEAHYQANHYENADPVIGCARLSSDPFDWSADLADEASRPFFGEASDFGIRYGHTIPIHDARGWIAAVTFATDRLRPAYRACMRRNADTLQLISQYFHAYARRTLNAYDDPYLTDCEALCLYWASQGKSARDIGEIVRSSERTVKFHLGNVRAKFRVSTTIQAAIAFDRSQRQDC